MVRKIKLLERARKNPAGLSFANFEALLKSCGWALKRQAGSHRVWKAPSGKAVPFQPREGKAKPYQVRQFLKLLDEEKDGDD